MQIQVEDQIWPGSYNFPTFTLISWGQYSVGLGEGRGDSKQEISELMHKPDNFVL